MKFDELDKKMRVFETAHDHCVLPGLFIVARLDGRGFTKLTKEVHKFEAPFDERFRDIMARVTGALVVETDALYGYTQSDEISLLLNPNCAIFNRKERKLNSVLAGKASAVFSLALGGEGIFDCRICQLPGIGDVVDYFRWRQEDATRNALNSHCYWLMRKQGKTARQASAVMDKMLKRDKYELLKEGGINFHELPSWQTNGIGVSWEHYLKQGFNPKNGVETTTARRRLKHHWSLPSGQDYASMIVTDFLIKSGKT